MSAAAASQLDSRTGTINEGSPQASRMNCTETGFVPSTTVLHVRHETASNEQPGREPSMRTTNSGQTCCTHPEREAIHIVARKAGKLTAAHHLHNVNDRESSTCPGQQHAAASHVIEQRPERRTAVCVARRSCRGCVSHTKQRRVSNQEAGPAGVLAKQQATSSCLKTNLMRESTAAATRTRSEPR